jgi:hypothetical protein
LLIVLKFKRRIVIVNREIEWMDLLGVYDFYSNNWYQNDKYPPPQPPMTADEVNRRESSASSTASSYDSRTTLAQTSELSDSAIMTRIMTNYCIHQQQQPTTPNNNNSTSYIKNQPLATSPAISVKFQTEQQAKMQVLV